MNLSIVSINASELEVEEFPFETFAPTLAQCYFIVLTGYCLSRFGILSSSDVEGVSRFASYVAMPAIICASLASESLNDLRWELLIGIALGKVIVFFIVSSFMVLLTSPSNLPRATIYALFCVQCNDLPVGNPLISSLYRNSRPYMTKYLFFIPCITVIVFGPLSFLMMHTTKSKRLTLNKEKDDVQSSLLRNNFGKYILKDLLRNPVVLATALGIILNLLFERQVPSFLYHTIQVLAETIPGLALSILGFNICGKESYLLRNGVVGGLALTVIKMVFTPVILHALVKGLTSSTEMPKELSDFALLYGVISPAAIVFNAAYEKSISIASMSVTLILSSFLCFPMSYLVAKLTVTSDQSFDSYLLNLQPMILYTACTSLTFTMCTLFGFVRRRHWRSKPHLCAFIFIICQVILCCCQIVYQKASIEWSFACSIVFVFVEMIMNLWMGSLFAAIMIRKRFSSFFGRKLFLVALICIIFAAMCTCGLIINAMHREMKSLWMYGLQNNVNDQTQLILMTIMSGCSLIVAFTGIINHHRHKSASIHRKTERCLTSYKYSISVGKITDDSELSSRETINDISKSTSSILKDITNSCCAEDPHTGISYPFPFGTDWTKRMMAFLTLLAIVFAIRLTTNVLKLLSYQEKSVMVSMEFLQNFLFVGQSIITFVTLGIDVRTLTMSFRKKLFSFLFEDDPFSKDSKRNSESVFAQFENFYSKCFVNLAREKMWKDKCYQNSFWGHDMVDWLISNGLAQNRKDGQTFARHLLRSGFFRHVENNHDFNDAPFLYCFTK